MGARIADARQRRATRHGEGGRDEHEHRVDQQDQTGPHHLGLLHLPAQEFRCAAHHQAGQKHRQQHEHQQVGDAGALAAEHHLQKQVEQGGQDGQGHRRIDRPVYRPGHRAGGHHRPQAAERRPEAQLLALQVAAAQPLLEQRIAGLLSCHGHPGADQQQSEHQRQQQVALAAVAHEAPEGIDRGRWDDQHGPGAHQVAEQGGVLVGVRRVGADEAAAVLAQLLDRLEQGDRSAGQELPAPLEGGDLQGWGQRHRYAAHQEEQSQQQRSRDQDPGERAQQVAIEVANRPATEAADHREAHRQAGGG